MSNVIFEECIIHLFVSTYTFLCVCMSNQGDFCSRFWYLQAISTTLVFIHFVVHVVRSSCFVALSSCSHCSLSDTCRKIHILQLTNKNRKMFLIGWTSRQNYRIQLYKDRDQQFQGSKQLIASNPAVGRRPYKAPASVSDRVIDRTKKKNNKPAPAAACTLRAQHTANDLIIVLISTAVAAISHVNGGVVHVHTALRYSANMSHTMSPRGITHNGIRARACGRDSVACAHNEIITV